MIPFITIEAYLNLDQQPVLIDVRAPSEFEHGHIPNAINLPLFSDDERAAIGTAYKQQSKEEAVLLGFEYAGPKWRSLIEQATVYAPSKNVVVHCWRGGMRSQALAWALQFAGFKVSIIHGGYKAYRNWVLKQFNQQLPLLVLGGKTGTRKTLVLHELALLKEQVVDLEFLAQHHGSIYGSMNQLVQPTQEQFENNLASKIAFFNLNKRIWIEDESLRIGKVVIPQSLRTQMQHAPLIVLELELQKRMDYLVEEYGTLDKMFLIEATKHIQKRLGPQRTKLAIEAIEENRMADFIQTVLEYYDDTYQFCVSKRKKDRVSEIKIQFHSDSETAKQLVDIIKK